MLRLFALLLVALLLSFPYVISQDMSFDEPDRWDTIRKGDCDSTLRSCGLLNHLSLSSAVCLKKAKYGKCGGRRKMWYFDIYKMKCDVFIYSNCGGNTNRFYSKEECDEFCASRAVEWTKKKLPLV
ncbi:hypothetical protein KR093_004738 [Drosophila rubida]|uniref:BPTI/Kunitz inhibitor domain-containing protein n=1 Tax=Drosophila rubida TaxID=30044 RepID=A0AAD4KGM1_9MUSC|nr:hypothetical protein KR093_004738 [Drosophila rubida]